MSTTNNALSFVGLGGLAGLGAYVAKFKRGVNKALAEAEALRQTVKTDLDSVKTDVSTIATGFGALTADVKTAIDALPKATPTKAAAKKAPAVRKTVAK